MFIVFVTTLAAGLMGVLAFCRMQQVPWKFVRLVAILTMCLLVPVLASFAMWGGWHSGVTAIWAAAITAMSAMAAFVVLGLAPVAKRYGSSVRPFAAIGSLLALLAAGVWGFEYHIWPESPGWGRTAAMTAQVLMALALGSVSLATVLGHAYLTHTSMTIHPLRRLARVFAFAMTARLAWAVLIGTLLAWRAIHNGALTPADLTGAWLLLGVRALIGLVIPAAFAYMVMETVRLRATQSATGILYFALVLVFIGELTSLHLLRELGIAF